MDVSIIYVNYKTADLIIDSIRSVKEHTTGIEYEIIVVDNCSEDHSLEKISAICPDVYTIQSTENVGFGRANNKGLEVAKGQCLFFLNPDTLLRNNAIAILYQYLNEHKEVGACGGNLYDESGQPTTSYSRRFPAAWQEFLAIFYLSVSSLRYPRSEYFNHTGRPLEVASIIGADLMTKREVLDRVGIFDPSFFLNYEETELCYRIHKAGYKILSVPEAEIVHFEGRSSYIKQSRLFFLYEGQYIYFLKKGGPKAAKRMYQVTQLKNKIRILQFILLRNKRKIEYWTMKRDTNIDSYKHFKEKTAYETL